MALVPARTCPWRRERPYGVASGSPAVVRCLGQIDICMNTVRLARYSLDVRRRSALRSRNSRGFALRTCVAALNHWDAVVSYNYVRFLIYRADCQGLREDRWLQPECWHILASPGPPKRNSLVVSCLGQLEVQGILTRLSHRQTVEIWGHALRSRFPCQFAALWRPPACPGIRIPACGLSAKHCL